jgi:dTDP-4-dehydrorhamnose reductase
MKNILILGAHGNLGCQIARLYPEAVLLDREEVDALDTGGLYQALDSFQSKFDVLINCVAYNDVDGAEENKDLAHKLNAQLPRQLAVWCRENGKTFLHISTGYVFSGHKESYIENDLPDPISVYGQSKAEGERLALDTNPNTYIVRTNLLFGLKGTSLAAKPSVVDVMFERGNSTKLLKGIDNEFASFTYTPDLAKGISGLVENHLNFGIYHIVNSGFGSWYDLASEIFRENPTVTVEKVLAESFVRKAKRPKFSVLENTKLPKFRPWQEVLCEYLKTLKLIRTP